MRRERFAPPGPLALAPSAFGQQFGEAALAQTPAQRAGVAVVEVRGPLLHHAGWWFDSYEGVRARVAEAFAARPKAVVMVLDSPGGLVNGCFETVLALREMSAEAKIPLYAYVDGMALSGAYALACACERIYLPETGMVGSVGVIDTRVDAREQAKMWGVSYAFVTSGARKTDGNSMVPLTDDELKATQERVEQLAVVFFEHVARARGLSVDAVRALEAGVLPGARAVEAQLADEVTTFDQLLASIASGGPPAQAGAAGDKTMSDKNEDEARKKLQAIIDDKDADAKAKARARKALAAMDEKDDEDEGEGAEGEDDKDDEDDDKGEEARGAGAGPRARAARPQRLTAAPPVVQASTAGELATRLSHLEQMLETEARNAILAGRPDLSPGLVKLLQSKPVEEVRAIVATIPVPKRPQLGEAAAAANVAGTRGEGQGGAVSQLPPEESRRLDEQMGIRRRVTAVVHAGTSMSLRAMTKAEAREYARKKEEAAAAAGATRA